jgi:hypothetical protein
MPAFLDQTVIQFGYHDVSPLRPRKTVYNNKQIQVQALDNFLTVFRAQFHNQSEDSYSSTMKPQILLSIEPRTINKV